MLSNGELEEIQRLQKKAGELRHMLVDLVDSAGASHIGGPLSACDAVTALFYHFMNFDKENACSEERDRFVLSKGHNGDLLYCVLADLGFYTKEELFREFKKDGGRWGEHPNRLHDPGFECSTGSLGHGLPIAAGMAMAAKLDHRDSKIFCLVGDGELQEGSNWESIMCAAKHSYDNLVLIVDKNGAQGTHMVKDLCDDRNLKDRLDNFGWEVCSVADGNDMIQLYEAFSELPRLREKKKPICLILHTAKGKAVQFMEDDPANCHAGGFKDGKLEKAHVSIDAWLKGELEKSSLLFKSGEV